MTLESKRSSRIDQDIDSEERDHVVGAQHLVTDKALESSRDEIMPASDQLFEIAMTSLRRRARQMLRGFRTVRRWDETDDVMQTVAMQLWRVFQDEPPESMRHFYALASMRIRWCLLSLARKYQGPLGLGTNHESWDDHAHVFHDPRSRSMPRDCPLILAQWTEFHRQAECLPGITSEVFHMIWYLELPAPVVAKTLQLSEITVRRHWRRARLTLAESLDKLLDC